jgi:hypothetical protein
VAALVEEVYVNDRVVHQVLPNPRKVDQWGYIMESELSSWSNTRQHQNLHTNIRLRDAKQRVLPTWGVWIAPALKNEVKLSDGEPRGWNPPDDDFLPSSSREPGTITGRCKFDSGGPRLVAGLVKDYLGDSGGGDNPEIRAFENIRGEIGVLRSNPTPFRVYEGD